jgi:hypothetical protein
MNKIVTFILSFFIILCFNSALYANSKVVTNQKTTKKYEHSNEKPISAIILGSSSEPGTEYNPNLNISGVKNKVAFVDPYTGHVNVKVPLLNVPIGGGLSVNLTITNIQRTLLIWQAVNQRPILTP